MSGTAPSAAMFKPKRAGANPKLECSNAGYTRMIRELLALVLPQAGGEAPAEKGVMREQLQGGDLVRV